MWHTAVNGGISPVLLRDGCLLWPNGKPCDDLQWVEPALDASDWAGEWRNCGLYIVDVLPWGPAEAHQWCKRRDAVRERNAARGDAVDALEHGRALQAQLDSEQRHADELVQRIGDVADALGEHRNPARSLAEDVRALVAECERLFKRDRDADEYGDALWSLAEGLPNRGGSPSTVAAALRGLLSAIRDALGCEAGGEVEAVKRSRAAVLQARRAAVNGMPQPGDVLKPKDFGKDEAGTLRLAALLAEAPEGAVVRWEGGGAEIQRQAGPSWRVVGLGRDAPARLWRAKPSPVWLAERAPLAVVAWPGG